MNKERALNVTYKFHDPLIAKMAEAASSVKAEMRSSGAIVGGTGTTGAYGGTATTPNTAAQAAQSAIANFLKVAPRKYYTILGTVAAGSAGGATANVIWQNPIPIIPAFCTAIDYTIQLPLTVTLGATTGSTTLSPFAPYSGVLQQMTLGGAPPWPLTELTPWYLDSIVHHINYDWDYPGLGNDSGQFATILDQGPIPNLIGGSTSLTPGTTVTNTTGAAVPHTYAWNFRVRQQLQRKRHLLWGSVPFGDPENRPNNQVQLSAFLGVNPEQNMFVKNTNVTSAVIKSASTCNVYAKYELAYIDLLPPNITSVPQPQVNYGLQLTPFSITNLAAGTLQPITHRTAQIYTSIHHVLVNGQLPLRGDYFGLWDDQDQQSARWSFDAQANTFTEYFDKVQRTYRRYLNTGHYVVTMENGTFPEISAVTPYDALMSPDATYAQTFGVPVTPAMTTTLRIPTGTTIATSYARVYSFGLVRVPY